MKFFMEYKVGKVWGDPLESQECYFVWVKMPTKSTLVIQYFDLYKSSQGGNI